MIQWFGISCGHDGSTVKVGGFCADIVCADPITDRAAAHTAIPRRRERLISITTPGDGTTNTRRVRRRRRISCTEAYDRAFAFQAVMRMASSVPVRIISLVRN